MKSFDLKNLETNGVYSPFLEFGHGSYLQRAATLHSMLSDEKMTKEKREVEL
jgi:hypothetical protein